MKENTLEKIIKTATKYFALESFDPSLEDFHQWLDTLPVCQALYYFNQGYEKSIRNHNFKRFYFEQKGHSMDRFMKQELSTSDFLKWRIHDQESQKLLKSLFTKTLATAC